VVKLKEPDPKNTILGTIGHGVCERWYLKEEMYPEDWHLSRNRWTNEPDGKSINNQEQALVKALIAHAIDDGTLTRLPDGEVEKEINFHAIDYEGYQVTFNGFIDYFSTYAAEVQDHKFCKTFKYHGKAKLKKAVAMNAYAFAAYEMGWVTKQDNIRNRYNLFRKDPLAPKIKRVEVERTYVEVKQFWEQNILPTIKDMVLYRKNAKGVFDVPGATNPREACNAFGMICPFFDICSGKETAVDYNNRKDGASLEAKKARQNNTLSMLGGNQKENKSMNFMDRMKAGDPGKEVPGDDTKKPPPNFMAKTRGSEPSTELEIITDEKKDVQDQVVMPWAFEGCPSCGTLPVRGMVDGNPCAVCDAFAERDGTAHSSHYNIVAGENGTISVSLKQKEAAPVETVKVVEKAASAPESVESQAPTAQEEEEISDLPIVGADMSRPEFAEKYYKTERKEFCLSYARVASRRPSGGKLGAQGHVIKFRDFFEAVCACIVDECTRNGVVCSSIYDLDTWKRDEFIKRKADVWSDMLGKSTVECVSVEGKEERSLLSCLEPRAATVYGEYR
jgi:hypothetical protein